MRSCSHIESFQDYKLCFLLEINSFHVLSVIKFSYIGRPNILEIFDVTFILRFFQLENHHGCECKIKLALLSATSFRSFFRK